MTSTRSGSALAGPSTAAGAVGILVLLGFLWFQKGQQVNNAKAQTEAQKAKNNQLTAEARKLEYIEVKAKSVSDREALVKASWAGEVSWYRVLQDVATTMPSQTWLTSFQAQSNKTAAASGGAGPGQARSALTASRP